MRIKKLAHDIIRDAAWTFCPRTRFTEELASKSRLKKWTKFMITEKDIQRAESSWVEKEKVVSEYKKKWIGQTLDPEYGMEESIENFIEKCPDYKSRDDKDRLRTDMWFYRFAYGFYPYEYVGYNLEQKDKDQRKEYISVRDKEILLNRTNGVLDAYVFGDKYLTFKKYEPYFAREAVLVKKKNHFRSYESFVNKHPVFVKKQVGMSGGRGVDLVSMPSLNKTKSEYFHELIAQGAHILEERVSQSKRMSAMNETSVNTARIVTLRTSYGIIIQQCLLRVGSGGQFIDNAAQGGILVGVDVASGQCITTGITEFGEQIERHPDTGTEFMGFCLPDWEQLVSTVKEMSEKEPVVKWIGWDMGHTEKGWVAIEGNAGASMGGIQLLFKRGYKTEIEELFSDVERIY
ncbi:MAG: hypothetical protein FWD27_06615 [Coriobacteriia bacterium]|nr:hypothetical protein [Coriobacteriia bacterium]